MKNRENLIDECRHWINEYKEIRQLAMCLAISLGWTFHSKDSNCTYYKNLDEIIEGETLLSELIGLDMLFAIIRDFNLHTRKHNIKASVTIYPDRIDIFWTGDELDLLNYRYTNRREFIIALLKCCTWVNSKREFNQDDIEYFLTGKRN